MPPRRLLSANLRRMPQTRERLLRSVCSYHFSILWPPIGPNAPMIRSAAPAHLALDRRQAPGPSSTISMRRFFARPSGVSFEPRVRRTYRRFRRQLRSASWPFRIDANGRPRPDLSKSTTPDRTVRGGYSTSGAAHATRPQRARLQRLRGDVQIRERHQTPSIAQETVPTGYLGRSSSRCASARRPERCLYHRAVAAQRTVHTYLG